MFKNFTGNLSEWLVGVKPDDDSTENCVYEDGILSLNKTNVAEAESAETDNKDEQGPAKESTPTQDVKAPEKESETEGPQIDTLHQIQFDFDEVSTKAVNTAKEWGSKSVTSRAGYD